MEDARWKMEDARWKMEKNDTLIFIFILGLFGLNWPFLEIFHVNITEYLFAFWLIFIILIALVVSRAEDKKDKFRANG
ncbi:hypothetical protein A45J_1162 [hot springs metagenome]